MFNVVAKKSSCLSVITKKTLEETKKTILLSGLFDEKWYCAQVNNNQNPTVNYQQALDHYVTYGASQGFQPNALFCPSYYTLRYEDVRSSSYEPLQHYILYGSKENRDPHPLFATEYYLDQLALLNLATPQINTILHYLRVGAKAHVSTHPLFDPLFYQNEKKDARVNFDLRASYSTFKAPLIEFIEQGGICGVSPHPLFHSAYYLRYHAGLKKIKQNPLIHYLEHGWAHRKNPHPLFHADWYLWTNPDVHQQHANPLMHYVLSGERENRDPSPLFDIAFYRSYYLENNVSTECLRHFVEKGWRKSYNPSPLVNLGHALDSFSVDSSQKCFPEKFFSQLTAAPHTALNPELYFTLCETHTHMEKNLLPFLRLKSRRDRRHAPETSVVAECIQPEKQKEVKGLSYYAPFTVVSGLGEACRGYLSAMQSANIVCRTVPTPVPNNYQKELAFPRSFAKRNWKTGIAHINADSLYSFLGTKQGEQFLEHEYRIGLWVWELPAFQTEWHSVLATFDEIWVPSNFCFNAVSAATSLPVHVVPHVVELCAQEELLHTENNKAILIQNRTSCRQRWDVPEDATVFLYVFDASSYIERKNPFALLDAYVQAFDNDPAIHLILKISYGHTNKQFQKTLCKRLEKIDSKRITVIYNVLEREELSCLMEAVDCYVSPHRSEGFGLTLAEALLREKPVIATDFGGTTDFITKETGYPLSYQLVEIEKSVGPYTKGNVWADVSIESLASCMQEVVVHYDVALTRAKAGRNLLKANNSLHAIGEKIKSLIAA
jgi:glycosyltransferase involved in cell wall biosynthesis